MQPANQTAPISKRRVWTGRILSALPAIFVLTSGINLSVMKTPEVLESFHKFGYPDNLITPIGIVEFLCAVVYIIPRTSVLGAILLTAYMGGATATHVRVNDPSLIVPVVVGIMIWAGLYLREDRLSALVPLRRG